MAIVTTNGKNWAAKIITFFKGNPILSVLASLAFLAIILPPRKRKRKSGRYYTRRKKRGNPGNPGSRKKRKKRSKKTRSGKRIPRSVGTTTKTKSKKRIPRSVGVHRTMPAKFVGAKKGTALMAEKMNWLRGQR
jgi:hypothetical protein